MIHGNKKMYVVMVLGIAALLGAAAAEELKMEPGEITREMINAVKMNDLSGFTAHGSDDFKSAMTDTLLNQVHGQFKDRLESGYKLEYLGNLNQQGHRVELFKLSFSNGEDDVLVRNAMIDGKVGGFWFQ